jgi:hypothetical protein
MMEKIYRVQMNSNGMPNFSTAVEITDRPQGEWIKDNLGTVICSECKRPRRDNRVNHINFCNSCGAMMKGATDGNK